MNKNNRNELNRGQSNRPNQLNVNDLVVSELLEVNINSGTVLFKDDKGNSHSVDVNSLMSLCEEYFMVFMSIKRSAEYAIKH